jgi:chromosomal replication initiator protein
MDKDKTWVKILGEIKQELDAPNFRTWFSKTSLDDLTDIKLSIATPSAFISDQLRRRYLPLIEAVAEKVLGKKIEVDFKVDASKLVKPPKEGQEDLFSIPAEVINPAPANILNPRFTLENFVVGLSNNVAFAAAQAVVQNPGTSYNPLFLYGGTGVGKTHLMLGIGNALLAKNPYMKVIYCSSEKFMNDYVEAIQTHKMGDLRNKYRSPNLFLLDDIQFFAGREGTQEEFFHTFNELQAQNCQMVLTSDRAPHEIGKLEDRLRSRFAGGLMVDIQPPDFDTRVAILKAKCKERGDVLPEESLRLLATSLESNIRELEGKLMQILQVLKLKNLPPTEENISMFLTNQPKKQTLNDPRVVLSTVCSYFNLNLKDLTGPKRQKELVLPRHIAMYLLSEELNMTVEKIGQILGGRDHTTVMHGRDKIKTLVDKDREVQRIVIEVKQKIIQ